MSQLTYFVLSIGFCGALHACVPASDTDRGGAAGTSPSRESSGGSGGSSSESHDLGGDGGSTDDSPSGGGEGAAGGATNETEPASCDLASSTDQFWGTPDCPSGVCHNLLLRSDGTYQTSTIVINQLGVVTNNFCEHGDWQQPPTSCTTMRLTPCDQPKRSVTWQRSGEVLTFADVHYRRETAATDEETFFIGCTVRRLCEGLTCGEVLACLKDCENQIIEDLSCGGRCIDRLSSEYTAPYDALAACVEQSQCTDDACAQQTCSAQFSACSNATPRKN